jgi:hypothetical protein
MSRKPDLNFLPTLSIFSTCVFLSRPFSVEVVIPIAELPEVYSSCSAFSAQSSGLLIASVKEVTAAVRPKSIIYVLCVNVFLHYFH